MNDSHVQDVHRGHLGLGTDNIRAYNRQKLRKKGPKWWKFIQDKTIFNSFKYLSGGVETD